MSANNLIILTELYFQITVSKWSGKSTCQSSDTINKVLSDIRIGVAITDYYSVEHYFK